MDFFSFYRTAAAHQKNSFTYYCGIIIFWKETSDFWSKLLLKALKFCIRKLLGPSSIWYFIFSSKFQTAFVHQPFQCFETWAVATVGSRRSTKRFNMYLIGTGRPLNLLNRRKNSCHSYYLFFFCFTNIQKLN